MCVSEGEGVEEAAALGEACSRSGADAVLAVEDEWAILFGAEEGSLGSQVGERQMDDIRPRQKTGDASFVEFLRRSYVENAQTRIHQSLRQSERIR